MVERVTRSSLGARGSDGSPQSQEGKLAKAAVSNAKTTQRGVKRKMSSLDHGDEDSKEFAGATKKEAANVKQETDISERTPVNGKRKKTPNVKVESHQTNGDNMHGMDDIPVQPEESIQQDFKVESGAPSASQASSSNSDGDEKVKTKSKTTAPVSAAKAAKDAKDAERSVVQLATVKARIAEDAIKREKAVESGKKSKSETYGLCEGSTPFPRWRRPTEAECQEVHDILQKHHPECRPQPATIPPPSQFVAGCGEVRSILDALIRTRLSASTTGRNSNAAYQGMVKRYGILKSGVGKGSVNYNAIRKAPVQDLFHAIKVGGLAVNKSADIKAILDLVYEENQQRRLDLIKMNENGGEDVHGKHGNAAQRAAEIKLADDENLSLDHCYILPTYDAIYKFMTYPGIGVKTAACVAMFCMQRPAFAVDTHVFRLAKWLGWVPPAEEKIKGEKNVDRDTTFSHLEVRIPDHLKYMLHQLFIKHGKTCPRCRGITGEGSANWNKGCVIDHLVRRTGAKKGGLDDTTPSKKGSPTSAKKGPRRRRRSSDDSSEDVGEAMSEIQSESESEDSEDMSDLHDDDEEDEEDGSEAEGSEEDSEAEGLNSAIQSTKRTDLQKRNRRGQGSISKTPEPKRKTSQKTPKTPTPSSRSKANGANTRTSRTSSRISKTGVTPSSTPTSRRTSRKPAG